MIIDVNNPDWQIYVYDDTKHLHVHFMNEKTGEKVEIQNAHLLIKGKIIQQNEEQSIQQH